MPTPPPLPRPLEQLPFHVSEATRYDVPSARLRRRDLISPFRGIRTARPVETLEDRCLAYLPLLNGRWFSHSTAALLWGMWLPGHLGKDIHVSARWPSREPRTAGVIGHRVSEEIASVGMVRGMPVASPAQCWCSLGPMLTLDELIVAGESVLRRQSPLAALEDLRSTRIRYGSRRGASQLDRALGQLRGRADSAKEVQLRLLLVRAGLPEPRVNLLIVDGEGEMFGDLAYPDWSTLVEYDGRQHLLPRQAAADILRHERLSRSGWTLVRVVQEHLDAPDRVAKRVARALADHGWRPPRSKLHLLR